MWNWRSLRHRRCDPGHCIFPRRADDDGSPTAGGFSAIRRLSRALCANVSGSQLSLSRLCLLSRQFQPDGLQLRAVVARARVDSDLLLLRYHSAPSVGMDWGDRGYWKVVTPHEVAHQWWRHTVGFSSYRDQWMSEGFADMSASLYLSVIEKNPKKFITFWNDERELLLERNPQGFRPAYDSHDDARQPHGRPAVQGDDAGLRQDLRRESRHDGRLQAAVE